MKQIKTKRRSITMKPISDYIHSRLTLIQDLAQAASLPGNTIKIEDWLNELPCLYIGTW